MESIEFINRKGNSEERIVVLEVISCTFFVILIKIGVGIGTIRTYVVRAGCDDYVCKPCTIKKLPLTHE